MNELIFLAICVKATCLGSGPSWMSPSDFLQRNQGPSKQSHLNFVLSVLE